MSEPFKLKAQVVPEKLIENQILTYLWYKRIWAWKVQNIGVYDAAKKTYRRAVSKFHIKGLPDVQGVLPPNGRSLFIEVKSAVGRPTPEQIQFIDKANENGALAFIARSVGEVEARLKQEGIVSENDSQN